MNTHTHTHSFTFSRTETFTYSLTHSMDKHTRAHTHTHTHILSHTHSPELAHTHTFSKNLSHTQTHASIENMHTQALKTQTRTHTHTHTQRAWARQCSLLIHEATRSQESQASHNLNWKCMKAGTGHGGDSESCTKGWGLGVGGGKADAWWLPVWIFNYLQQKMFVCS